MNIYFYQDAIHEVIEWNSVGKNGKHDFSIETIKSQIDYTEEEILETIAAVAVDDRVEIMDGLADILVTLGYKWFLVNSDKYAEFDFLTHYSHVSPKEMNRAKVIKSLSFMLNDVHATNVCDITYDLSMLYDIFMYYEFRGVDTKACVAEVLESNWSKFPIIVHGVDQECEWIEQNHKHNGPVKANTVSVSSGDYTVFRDNDGIGKIKKPRYFKEPDLKPFI